MLLKTLVLTVLLFVLWLLLSGIYKPFILFLGILSCLMTIYIVRRMKIIENTGLLSQISPMRHGRYLFWLLKEIVIANLAVTKTVIRSIPRINQSLFFVETSQSSDLAKVIYANSITLTPGTITVETEPGQFLIHALTEEAADLDALALMDRNVTLVEKPGSAT